MDGRRTAACLSVGTELLCAARLDRNSLRIAGRLADFGIEVVEKRAVGDDPIRIADAVSELVTQLVSDLFADAPFRASP